MIETEIRLVYPEKKMAIGLPAARQARWEIRSNEMDTCLPAKYERLRSMSTRIDTWMNELWDHVNVTSG